MNHWQFIDVYQNPSVRLFIPIVLKNTLSSRSVQVLVFYSVHGDSLFHAD
jgi:hypothetical protein